MFRRSPSQISVSNSCISQSTCSCSKFNSWCIPAALKNKQVSGILLCVCQIWEHANHYIGAQMFSMGSQWLNLTTYSGWSICFLSRKHSGLLTVMSRLHTCWSVQSFLQEICINQFGVAGLLCSVRRGGKTTASRQICIQLACGSGRLQWCNVIM